MANRIKKGDIVIVKSGKDKGKKGKVLRVLVDRNCLVIEKINLVKKHQRATQKFQGGIVEKPAPIKADKVMPVCSRCGKATRIGHKYIESEEMRVRVCKKCNEVMDKV